MKQLYYIKKGRRYVPVAEYDSDLLDSFPKGNHLVMCYPGGSSRRFNVDPALAPMIAAGRVAEDAICSAISKASELKPERTPITPAQQQAWQRLREAFGSEITTLRGLSVHDCAEAGVQAMIAEADKLLSNPAVRKAYERFQLVCDLTKENEVK
jgi:hypothetical protein